MTNERMSEAENLARKIGELTSTIGIGDLRRLVRMVNFELQNRTAEAESDLIRHRTFDRPEKAKEVEEFINWYREIRSILPAVVDTITFGYECESVSESWREQALLIQMIGGAIATRLIHWADVAELPPLPEEDENKYLFDEEPLIGIRSVINRLAEFLYSAPNEIDTLRAWQLMLNSDWNGQSCHIQWEGGTISIRRTD